MAKTREKFDTDQIISSFRKKQFAPVYFFCGEESFLIDEVVDVLVEQAVDPAMKEFNLDVIHGNEIDGKKIVSLASSYPMMSDRRVVIIRDFDRVNGKEAVEAYIDHSSESTTLVLISGTPDFRKKPYITFKKAGIVREASLLRDYETTAWIESRLKKLKRSMEPAAVQLLYSYVGSSLRELSNEIEKLLLFVGEEAVITVKDVEHVVGVSREFSPFELANKIGEKNIVKAMEIAERLISSGESLVGIIAGLTQHFIKLWKLKDGMRLNKGEQELASLVSAHPYYLKSYLAQAKNYLPAELENVFVLLAEADLAAKSSGDQKRILTTVIAEIISGNAVVSAEAAVV